MRNLMNKQFWQKLWKNERGFTLLEVVAATFIAGTVVVGSVVVLGTAIRSSNQISGSLELQQLVQAQIETIQQARYIERPTEPPVDPLGPEDTYPIIGEPNNVSVTFEEDQVTVTVTYSFIEAGGDDLGITMSFVISDAGTNYRYPNPDGTFVTNVVQRVDVTASDDNASVTMSFYKISAT